MTTKIVQSSDGKHLGFVPVYNWRGLTGLEHVHHGNTYRSEAEALAATQRAKPATWAAWTVTIERVSTHFADADVQPVRATIRELICGQIAQGSY